MKISEVLRRMLITRKCVLCNELIDYDRKAPICDDCETCWDDLLEVRCNRCGGDRHNCSCLPALVKKYFPISSWGVFYTSGNSDEANMLVFRLKYRRIKDVIDLCTEVMKDSLLETCRNRGINYKDYAVTYSPRRKSSKRKYMFDHAREMAKRLAKILEIDFVDALENIGTKEQKTLTYIERRKNAQSSYILKSNFKSKHKKYFLVDDIMTTGSTLVYCSRLLYEAGANEVIPVTYAKDNYKYKGD